MELSFMSRNKLLASLVVTAACLANGCDINSTTSYTESDAWVDEARFKKTEDGDMVVSAFRTKFPQMQGRDIYILNYDGEGKEVDGIRLRRFKAYYAPVSRSKSGYLEVENSYYLSFEDGEVADSSWGGYEDYTLYAPVVETLADD